MRPAPLALMAVFALGCHSPLDDTATDPDTVGVDPIDDNQSASTGDFAHNFLSSNTYDRLLIEIDYVEGHRPASAALSQMKVRLERLVDKPGGITVLVDDAIADQGSPSWTEVQTLDVETVWRDHYRDPQSGQAVLYMLYLDGHSSRDTQDGRILGFAYQGSSIVMFQESIAASGGGLFSGDIEPVVLLHEVGHQLGLVNLGTPMAQPHEDPEHSGHDANDDCIMFWQAETSQVTELLLGGAPDFDDACLNDLAANGGLP